MSHWAEGYLTDIGYTYGYYTELNPVRIRLAFLAAGLNPPEIGTACELGFGQGMSINMHAAASVVDWHGTDFNPSQASFAKHLATISGNGAKLYDQSFQEFCSRTDLPDFDYIGLHGIWSWISDQNRTIIVDFLRRKLKIGGVLYISYNTLPGWSSFAPLRHLMSEHASVFGASGRGVLKNISSALDFTGKLLDAKPGYLRATPLAAERFSTIKTQNKSYLAHEYFNKDWMPMYFSAMADWLAPAKLSYACSTHLVDHVDGVNLTPEQSQLMATSPDPMFRETIRDFMVNQQFRRDYWVKGPQKLPGLELSEMLGEMRFILVQHRSDIALKVIGALGEASMTESVYEPVLDLMADHKPRSLFEMEAELKSAGTTPAQLREIAIILTGGGQLALVQDDQAASKARKVTDSLNQYVMSRARGGHDFTHLASPVIGGGVPVNRFQQLFLQSMRDGRKKPAEWAEATWQNLVQQGQKILKDGKALESNDDNIAELNEQAVSFQNKNLPVLKALQII